MGKTARERQRLPAELSQLNQNAGGIDVGASSISWRCLRTAQSRRCASSPALRRTCIAWRTGLRSAAWRPWSWSPPGCTGYPCLGAGRARVSGDVGGPQAHQERVRAQDRRAGLPVAAAAAHYGLLSGAFRPEAEIRRLRSYLRQRAMLVQYASHHIQHMQKALTQMNVKLQHVISDITGKTGMDIMEAIVGGERDPRKLARLRDARIKADEATIAGRCGGTGARSTSRADPSPGAVPVLPGQDRRVRPGD